ncbi:DNA translocase FtsK 4TM domain-containing protein, partial [Pseudokineococcus marinus]|uniref:DNA translocase FtsK 4TM domain-containing protein n=1 Tax=Pseudokineococcus marinus TaxID=351215 RepID=UPI0031D0CE2F
MATRGTTTARRSGSTRGSGSGTRGGSPRSSGPDRRGGSRPAPRTGASLAGRAARGAWTGTAHVVGGAVRRVGDGARDLDPAHRRDGLAFALLGLGILVAAREWWGITGTLGTGVHVVVAGLFGLVGLLVPVLLLASAVRLMRHPDSPAARGRSWIGVLALLLAACGLVHLAAVGPQAPATAQSLQAGGGALGYAAAVPLAAGASPVVAVPLLVLLGVFGVLVLTATPVHAVPDRLRDVLDRLPGRRRGAAEDEEPADRPRDDEDVPAAGRRRGRRPSAADASGEAAGEAADRAAGEDDEAAGVSRARRAAERLRARSRGAAPDGEAGEEAEPPGWSRGSASGAEPGADGDPAGGGPRRRRPAPAPEDE